MTDRTGRFVQGVVLATLAVMLVALAGGIILWRDVTSGNTVVGRLDRNNTIQACRGTYSAKVSGALAQEIRAFGSIVEAGHNEAAVDVAEAKVAAADRAFDGSYAAYLAALSESNSNPSAFLAHCTD